MSAPQRPIHLDAGALARLGEHVDVPTYDRAAGEKQIVHLGVGGFHRAHLAQYADALHRAGETSWRLIGVGVLEHDRALRNALAAQDGLYTLVTVDPDGSEHARVIGAISRYLFAPDEADAVVDAMSAPETRIISLTITEGGYEIDGDGRFSPRSASVLGDLEAMGERPPASALGLIVAALRRRQVDGAGPVTIMSCDNLPHNGEVTRTAVEGVTARLAPDLLSWLRENVTFPSSMVDRITPATTDRTRQDLEDRFGIEDAWPVRAESFLQWVLEDDFAGGRPVFEQVGVQVVDDVGPYEQMKLRLLNASHQVVGHVGLLLGHEAVHVAMRDPDLGRLVGRFMRAEALPTLGEVPGIDLEEYCRALEERFSGDAVRDSIARQVAHAADRVRTFLLPVVSDRLAAGGRVELSALVLASWASLLERSEHSEDLSAALVDPLRPQLLAAVREESHRPGALLHLVEIFGDLGAAPGLIDAYLRARELLRAVGPREAIRRTLDLS